ncbi:rhizopine-binding protein [Amylibacter kogurei]|uniref:Rhizopine-binding protein n=1 Tax=Paramylibacter kogurei TaxID=1889778 RepID=A0A2G5K7T2_9RHOB|nr:substrate-binding domain-containing protein [Amylibacter kogurei]PIB25597.1 rhizopine-binding protein [Amylibacter kogurei]
MKRSLLAAGLVALMGTSTLAQDIGATISRFDDNWLTVMRNGMTEHAASIDGVNLQMEDATDDLAKQIDQVKNFVASGVDAIIVNIVDTSAGAAISEAAGSTPLVYVNRQPDNVDSLPATQAFVASNEIESGTLSAFQVCNNLRAEGKAGGARGYLMNGQLSNQAAVQRSKDVHDVIGMDMCSFMTIIDEQTANWSRDEAQDLMTNWMSSGEPFDFVLANNDEMAIGAIQAMKAAGMDMADVQVGGVDASQDALLTMQAGDYDVTVFQDAFGQGAGSVDTALAIVAGDSVDQKVYIPFKLVTPANMDEFLSKN